MNAPPLIAPMLVAVCCLLSVYGRASGAADTAPTLPDADHWPAVAELPDPFTFVDGSRVKTQEDWKKRRAELLELFLNYEYGKPPSSPGNITATAAMAPTTQPRSYFLQYVTLTMGPEHALKLPVTLARPIGDGPFPVIINGDLGWGEIKPQVLSEMLKRGYAFAQFDRTVIADDSADTSKGIYPLYPEVHCGRLAAWAWGYSRVIDYLMTRPDIDHTKITISGHSRGGKAVLLAGAMDERVALTVPNGSGCGGAGCYRVNPPKTETLKVITDHFPFWFIPVFKTFEAKVEHLPFDQHELKALVAPRGLLTTDAAGDVWANAPGTQATYQAAKVVYDFLGAKQNIGIHYRPGGHEQNEEDWKALLDFADQLYFGKQSPQPFDKLPLPDEPVHFSWKAPAGG